MVVVTIRKAHLEELPIIQDLNHQLFLFDAARDPDLNLNWPLEKEGEAYFKKKIAGEVGVCFVAEVDGAVVGYLAGAVSDNMPSYRPVKRSELENIFILEDYRRAGAGRKLVQAFVDWSHDQDVTNIFVAAYFLNEKAVKFYEGVGFKPLELELQMH